MLGIDEAGRGAVIGPLVICGLAIDDSKEPELKKLGVKDSKELKPKKREQMAKQIDEMEFVDSYLIPISACMIDSERKAGINLNQIEAKRMADIINMARPDVAIVDTPSYNSHKFKDYLYSKLDDETKKVKLVCENYADKNYPVVSAASILAKVERDKKIEQLKKEFNYDFGVGYSHDARTIAFLEKLAKENNGKMPKNIRTTWETVQEILKKYEQKGLSKFIKNLVK